MSEIKEKSAPEVAASRAENKRFMKNSISILEQAEKKIKSFEAKKLGQLSQKVKAIAEPTANALVAFCEQSEEFARAVIDGDDFINCLIMISKDFGNAVSDFEVYSKAVQFYFPGAVIKFEMKILMSEYELESTPNKENLSLSLDSLLDW
ncbi:hypothetical protein [Pseudoruminococcus massiliensis]|uniref:hypothetical protein n=1 Tax=Pseudoruminococcus massiliensis TaxID=2086583 RepID=UPI0022E7ECB8|nr:hypothetical protein [Pseudoruminococcus massiliensis]